MTMAQRCYASISDTGLHCAWCVTRISLDGFTEAFCEKHSKACRELGYYCSGFIGYKPDYRITDEEEKELIDKLRND